MEKVYVETSFFSACVSKRQTAKSAGWRASSLEWWEKERKLFELFVSSGVSDELSDPRFPQKDAALDMLEGIPLLTRTIEVEEVARLLVEKRVMPGPMSTGDAVH